MIYVEPAHWEMIKSVLGPSISKFYAFGSRVKGTHKTLSDLDLVYHNDVPDREIIRITHEFDDSNLPYKVDIVNSAHCSDEFKALIEADKVPLSAQQQSQLK